MGTSDPDQMLIGGRSPRFVWDSDRGEIASEAMAGRALVLIFLPSLHDDSSRAYLRGFVANQNEYKRLEAKVLVITAGLVPPTMSIPFPVISGEPFPFEQFQLVHDEGPWAGVVIVDRYGSVAHWESEPTPDLLPSQPRVAQLVQSAESSCPECGTPEQHWLEAVR
jgi:hypothetical protein